MTWVEALKLLKAWVELGIRYSRGQCTPEEEFAVGVVIAALSILAAALVCGSLQLAWELLHRPSSLLKVLDRVYLPPKQGRWRNVRKRVSSRFSASKYYKWVGHT